MYRNQSADNLIFHRNIQQNPFFRLLTEFAGFSKCFQTFFKSGHTVTYVEVSHLKFSLDFRNYFTKSSRLVAKAERNLFNNNKLSKYNENVYTINSRLAENISLRTSYYSSPKVQSWVYYNTEIMPFSRSRQAA